MSGSIEICPKCGGEVRVSDNVGANCPNCGGWVSVGCHNSVEIEMNEYERHRAEVKERMKHVIKVVVECSEVDDDRIYEWSKEFSNYEDAKAWANSQSGCREFFYYDEEGLIE